MHKASSINEHIEATIGECKDKYYRRSYQIGELHE